MDTLKKNIPNAITCLNLIGGCMAILLALQGEGIWWCGLKAYEWAFIFIGISAVADFLDGFAARMLHVYSALGKELDSLCDMVSFGVAPGLLLWKCLQVSPFTPSWLPWMAVLIPVGAALRLARFNIDTRQTTSFIGLPVPANAIFWIGFVAAAYADFGFLLSPWLTLGIIILESYLMVSPMRIFSLKMTSLGWKGNARRWILFACAAVLVTLMHVPGLMWTIIVYVCLAAIKVKIEKA